MESQQDEKKESGHFTGMASKYNKLLCAGEPSSSTNKKQNNKTQIQSNSEVMVYMEDC